METKETIREYFATGKGGFGAYLTVKSAQKRIAREVIAQLRGFSFDLHDRLIARCEEISFASFCD